MSPTPPSTTTPAATPSSGGGSYVDKVTDTMHQLLWNNILRHFVAIELVALPLEIPVVGAAISAALANPFVQDFVLFLISKYIEMPLFNLLARWGVFTSVDWKEDGIYSAYEAKAMKLLPIMGKPDKEWTKQDDEEFTNAADDLMELHIPGWNAA